MSKTLTEEDFALVWSRANRKCNYDPTSERIFRGLSLGTSGFGTSAEEGHCLIMNRLSPVVTDTCTCFVHQSIT